MSWPALPFEAWRATRDTLHAHTQVLGKLAVALAPPEPQLQHAALRLSARGWETLPLPAPDGSGALVVALDLRSHEAVVEHSDGRVRRVALAPDRPVGEVTREVLAAIGALVGPVEINTTPQETPWTTPLDEDTEHASYDPVHVAVYFAAATQAALVLAALRAPYRGRSTPVNAWWGSFDFAVSLFSGEPADPPSQDFITRNAMDAEEVAVGWWPTPTRRRKGLPTGSSRLRVRTGTRRLASSSSTGTTSGPPRTPTRPRSASPARRLSTVAGSAAGTPGSQPAWKATRRRLSDCCAGRSSGAGDECEQGQGEHERRNRGEVKE